MSLASLDIRFAGIGEDITGAAAAMQQMYSPNEVGDDTRIEFEGFVKFYSNPKNFEPDENGKIPAVERLTNSYVNTDNERPPMIGFIGYLGKVPVVHLLASLNSMEDMDISEFGEVVLNPNWIVVSTARRQGVGYAAGKHIMSAMIEATTTEDSPYDNRYLGVPILTCIHTDNRASLKIAAAAGLVPYGEPFIRTATRKEAQLWVPKRELLAIGSSL